MNGQIYTIYRVAVLLNKGEGGKYFTGNGCKGEPTGWEREKYPKERPWVSAVVMSSQPQKQQKNKQQKLERKKSKCSNSSLPIICLFYVLEFLVYSQTKKKIFKIKIISFCMVKT